MNKTSTIINILKAVGLKTYAYSREPNSPSLCVVVSDESIDIHAKNIIDSTQPDLPNFKATLDKIHSVLGFLDDGVLTKNNDSNWYVKISLENVGDVFKDVTMHENKSLSDGYGGSVVFNENVWQGNVWLSEVRSDLSLKGGAYRMITNAIMIVPKDLYVKKNNYFIVDGIKFVVNGVVENNIYVSRGQ